jgi:alkylhydroperoxidase family enzyme
MSEIRILDTHEGTEVYSTGKGLDSAIHLVQAVAGRLRDRVEVRLTDPDLTEPQRDALEEFQALVESIDHALDEDADSLEALKLL